MMIPKLFGRFTDKGEHCGFDWKLDRCGRLWIKMFSPEKQRRAERKLNLPYDGSLIDLGPEWSRFEIGPYMVEAKMPWRRVHHFDEFIHENGDHELYLYAFYDGLVSLVQHFDAWSSGTFNLPSQDGMDLPRIFGFRGRRRSRDQWINEDLRNRQAA